MQRQVASILPMLRGTDREPHRDPQMVDQVFDALAGNAMLTTSAAVWFPALSGIVNGVS
jgi:hypothetical protein